MLWMSKLVFRFWNVRVWVSEGVALHIRRQSCTTSVDTTGPVDLPSIVSLGLRSGAKTWHYRH